MPPQAPSPTGLALTRARESFGCLRTLRVLVGGREVGLLRVGGRLVVPAGPGSHAVTVRMDWCGSWRFAAQVRDGALTELECGCRWPLWWWPAWFPVVVFLPRRLFYVAPRGAGALARPRP